MEFEFSENFWNKFYSDGFGNKRAIFLTVADRMGESLLYERIIDIAQDEQYDYIGARFNESLSDFFITRHFYVIALDILGYILKPKFNLALTHHVKILPKGYNVTYLNMPTSSLFFINRKFNDDFHHLAQYDAYVDIYSLVHGSNPKLEQIALDKHGNKKIIIGAYFGRRSQGYKKLHMDKALITGTLWGCNRASLRIFDAIAMLAKEDMLVATGGKDYFSFLNDKYIGSMEKIQKKLNEPKLDTLFDLVQEQYGIALILHNLEHMIEGIPTSRMAEAITSGAIIISDKNIFLEKFFGDNILYIDSLKPAYEIYEQTKNHIMWARDNQGLAHQKTQKAHEIFINNFSLEKQFKIFETQIMAHTK